MINRTRLQGAITIALVIANLGLLVFYVSGWTNPLVQNNKKSIIRRLSFYKDPVEVSIELKGQPVKSNEAVLAEQEIRSEDFEADTDWLRNLTLKLTNRSDKTITYLAVYLLFPETATATNRSEGLYQIYLGTYLDHKFTLPDLRLMPGESIEVPLATRYDEIKTLVESRVPLAGITKVELDFRSAMFDDGTYYDLGELFRRNTDPSDPHKWIKIKERGLP
jgi:hypothetical protein